MGVFNDNEISSTVFTLLGTYCGLLELMEAAEPGAEGQDESGRHFSF